MPNEKAYFEEVQKAFLEKSQKRSNPKHIFKLTTFQMAALCRIVNAFSPDLAVCRVHMKIYANLNVFVHAHRVQLPKRFLLFPLSFIYVITVSPIHRHKIRKARLDVAFSIQPSKMPCPSCHRCVDQFWMANGGQHGKLRD